jgi:hypothetical protein
LSTSDQIFLETHPPENSGDYLFLNFTVEEFEQGRSSQMLEEEIAGLEAMFDSGGQLEDRLDEADGDTVIQHGSPWALSRTLARPVYRDVDAHLLQYYINVLSPNCSLSTTQNPYVNVLLPVAYEFEPLRNALLAAAANQLRLEDDLRFETRALELKTAAINGLRKHLTTNAMDWESLATTLMFCFYDVCCPLSK